MQTENADTDGATIRCTSSEPDIIPGADAAVATTPATRFFSNSRSLSSASVLNPRSWSARLKLIAFGRRNHEAADLTEESLVEHNRRLAIFDGKNTRSGPYYKGLTDSSLAIHRRPRGVATSSVSPRQESLATSIRTSSSSIASFIVKMKDLGSCFGQGSFKMKKESVYPPRKVTVPKVGTSTTLMKEMRINLIEEKSDAAPVTVVNKGSGNSSWAFNDQSPSEMVVIAEMESLDEMGTIKRKSDAAVTLDATAATAAAVDDDEEKPSRESMVPSEQRNSYRSTIGGRWCGRPPIASSQKMVAAAAVVPEPEPFTDDSVRESDKKKDTEAEAEGNFVWATLYRPKALEGFICNKDKAVMLQRMIMSGDCGHFIFEGQPGVGKKTMIWAMIREVFGPDNIQTHSKTRVFNLEGESRGSIEVVVKESSHHIEVTVSELKGYEKHVIVELIKETHLRLSKKDPRIPENCRVMILHEADKLSSDALLYIRWLLGRYKHMKVFFCCSDVSKLQPIKMLCTVVHLLPPSKEEVVEVLEFIAKQEGIDLPHKLAERIADSSKNNLRQAIRSFEASWHKSYPFTEDQPLMTGWEDVIATIAKKITEEQSPKQLFIVRGKLRMLIEHDVSSDFIFKSLVEELKKHLDESLQNQVNCFYMEYNANQGEFEGEKVASSRDEEKYKRSNDPIKRNIQHFMKIEEFVARFMSCYKSSIRNKNVSTMHHIGMSCDVLGGDGSIKLYPFSPNYVHAKFSAKKII